MSQPRSGFLPERTVHLHPLARCNLACLHCYSASSPQATGALEIAALERALGVLRAERYDVLSLSGGEPLLYPELGRLIGAARALGFRVVAVSNGYRVRPEFDDLIGRLDGLAISFDGPREVHDRVRGRSGAFEVAIAALAHLRAIGVPSAAAYTVSTDSLPAIPDFAEVVCGLGVRALQLRPLVMAGRAPQRYAGAALGATDALRLFLVGAALAEAYAGEMAVHTDLAYGRAIAAGRAAYARLADADAVTAPLADVVNPMVITPNGAVKPLTYDFPSGYDLGDISDLAEGRTEALKRRTPPLRLVIERALDAAGRSDAFLDWFAFCRDLARQVAPTRVDLADRVHAGDRGAHGTG